MRVESVLLAGCRCRVAAASDSAICLVFAEIIKYGLIRDAALFQWLEQNMGRLLQRDPEVIRNNGKEA
jgi:3-dehydroquinate synthetase